MFSSSRIVAEKGNQIVILLNILQFILNVSYLRITYLHVYDSVLSVSRLCRRRSFILVNISLSKFILIDARNLC